MKIVVIDGLPSGTSVRAMLRAAERFGDVTRIVIEHDWEWIPPVASCWITFRKQEDATKAILDLDGRVVDGRRLAVQCAADADDPMEKGSERLQGAALRENFPLARALLERWTGRRP